MRGNASPPPSSESYREVLYIIIIIGGGHTREPLHRLGRNNTHIAGIPPKLTLHSPSQKYIIIIMCVVYTARLHVKFRIFCVR